jgi:hypothetical protein
MENNEDFDPSKPDFLNSEWFKDIQRQSAEEIKAIADAIDVLQKVFDVKDIIFGYQGNDFIKNQCMIVFKLRHRTREGLTHNHIDALP